MKIMRLPDVRLLSAPNERSSLFRTHESSSVHLDYERAIMTQDRDIMEVCWHYEVAHNLMMEATARSVTLLTSCGRREGKKLKGIKPNIQGQNEHAVMFTWSGLKWLCAAQVLQEITHEENLLHKLKSLILPAPPLFKWLFNFNPLFIRNDNFFEGLRFVRTKECFHLPESYESINDHSRSCPGAGSRLSTSHHINLCLLHYMPPCQKRHEHRKKEE